MKEYWDIICLHRRTRCLIRHFIFEITIFFFNEDRVNFGFPLRVNKRFRNALTRAILERSKVNESQKKKFKHFDIAFFRSVCTCGASSGTYEIRHKNVLRS